MKIASLDHVNIRTTSFDDTVTFYEDVLGLVRRPAASAVGRAMNCWLATEEGAVVIHVNGLAPGEPVPSRVAGTLDHFAFRCTDLAGARGRLDAAALPYEERRLAARNVTQLVVLDPNGIKVELAFEDGPAAIVG